ncbi:hypothetical protein LJR143_002697 [Pseudoxanthomonas sp. LjRoot143]|uniref:hypothetical protein n=1 Tax=Pseudoxanthomonas sp. LjRoot143 TaxID=3342266 RepID=UPI003ECC8415
MLYKHAMQMVGIGLLVLGGIMAVSSDAHAQAVTPGVACEPYNSRWNVCTRTFFNYETGKWDQEVYYAPRKGMYDEIEP